MAIRRVGRGGLLTTNPTGARSARKTSCGQPMATKHLFGLTAAVRCAAGLEPLSFREDDPRCYLGTTSGFPIKRTMLRTHQLGKRDCQTWPLQRPVTDTAWQQDTKFLNLLLGKIKRSVPEHRSGTRSRPAFGGTDCTPPENGGPSARQKSRAADRRPYTTEVTGERRVQEWKQRRYKFSTYPCGEVEVVPPQFTRRFLAGLPAICLAG